MTSRKNKYEKHNIFRALALIALIALAPTAPAQSADIPAIECGVSDILKYGHLVLDISPSALFGMGYAFGDRISVDIAGQVLDMPIVTNYDDVDNGALGCVVRQSENDDESDVLLVINLDDLATWLGIAEKQIIDEKPGFRWDYAEEYQDGVPVTISMKEQGGYADQLALHRLTRTNNREDYPGLTDAEFANFRNVATTFGVGDIAAPGVDLAACAETWLLDSGMTADDIAALKTRLGTDIL